ncbi:hypothetical protein WK28_04485 [Burkholderia vietnamiensis]|nr:hypothetical protein WK28_04485 [Burkholderia vietnamiensis]
MQTALCFTFPPSSRRIPGDDKLSQQFGNRALLLGAPIHQLIEERSCPRRCRNFLRNRSPAGSFGRVTA